MWSRNEALHRNCLARQKFARPWPRTLAHVVEGPEFPVRLAGFAKQGDRSASQMFPSRARSRVTWTSERWPWNPSERWYSGWIDQIDFLGYLEENRVQTLGSSWKKNHFDKKNPGKWTDAEEWGGRVNEAGQRTYLCCHATRSTGQASGVKSVLLLFLVLLHKTATAVGIRLFIALTSQLYLRLVDRLCRFGESFRNLRAILPRSRLGSVRVQWCVCSKNWKAHSSSKYLMVG